MYKIWAFFSVAICCASALVFPNQTNVERITAGSLASESQFPYMVSIQQLSLLPNQIQAHRCGGAMITLQHALTAASCTFYYDVNSTLVQISAAQYRVYAGSVLLSGDNVPERIRTVTNYTIHPDHLVYPALFNDIAIFTLTTPYLNTTVMPIPYATANLVPNDFTLCTVAGWGAPNSLVAASNELRYATKYIYSHQLCTNLFNSMAGVLNVHSNMLCAASYDILSVGCTGDEGSPLICNGELTGILSLTNRCQTTSYPEIYTRVSNYTEWIRSVTGGASTFKPQLGLFAIIAVMCLKMFS